DLAQAVRHRLADIRECRVTVERADVESVGMACFRQQLLRLGRVEGRRRGLSIEFEVRRYESIVMQQRMAQLNRLIDVGPVEPEIGGLPHPQILPWRLRVPLLGEIKPLRRGMAHGEFEAWSALQFFG